MKNVVAIGEIRETELRSQKIFDQYIKLLEKDIPIYFNQKEDRERTNCPACGSTQFTDQFKKLSFYYRDCNICGTMFVSHRASDQSLSTYMKESASYKFFVNEYLENIEQANGINIQSTRANWIFDSIIEYDAPQKKYLDLSSKYPYLLNNIGNANFFDDLLFARPEFNQQQHTLPLFKEKKCFKDNDDQSISAITAFEYLDGIFNPEEFIKQAYRILEDNGLLFLTTRCISGFDMQILQKDSNSILPPRHVSLFSIEGLIKFFESNGFVIQELSTPGQLDLDIIAAALEHNDNINIPKFVKYIIEKRDIETQVSFKKFLQEHRLSSYARIVVQKTVK